MNVSLIIFIIIHFLAFIYLIEALRRIHKRIKEFPLIENRATLPLGFIRLRHIVILYFLAYIVWVILSFMLYAYFITPTFSFDSGYNTNAILNL